VEISPADLLLQLQNSELVVRVSNPPHDERAAYRSAISRAITYGLVPGGYALRHKGRDRGDLVIRLVSLAESPPPVEPLPPIPVPKTLRDAHAAVRMLRDEAHSMDVSSESKPRALLLVQAIGDECARRGYTLSRTEDVGTTFWISIGDDQFPFTLAEEFERREVLDEKQLAAAKYAWQRVPARVRQVRSGRLLLRLGSGYGSVFWADRRRWSLDEKLPAMFKEIEDRAERQVAARISAEARRVARLQEWERALLRARQAYIEDLNRGRLTKQVAASGQAVAIRAYCDRIGAILDQTADDHRSQVNQWLAWARAEADRVDPLSHPKSLAYVLPDDVRTSELGRFMPKGMSAWHPPS
jgi:hypothetical protein